MNDKITRYFFYDRANKIIYYSENPTLEFTEYEYLGTSDNPKPKMAAVVFAERIELGQGIRVKNHDK